MDNRAEAIPDQLELVLAGGGHSHALVLRMLGMDPLPGVRLTLVSDVTHTPYSGMLPGYVAGYYDYDEVHIDLRRLAEFAGARFVRARVCGVDPAGRRLLCDGHPPLAWDYLSLNTGSTPSPAGIRDPLGRAIPVKPVPDFLRGWLQVREAVAGGEGARRILVIGGGAGGVELILAMQQALPRAEYHLVQGETRLLPTHNPGVRRHLTRLLETRGVTLHGGDPVAQINAAGVETAGGRQLDADDIFLVTRAAAPGWISTSGLPARDGFIRITPTLQVEGHPRIFAAGDMADMVGFPRPRSGVYAVRHARPLHRNLRRLLQGKEPRPFRPQKRFLSLIGTPVNGAIASRGRLHLASAGMWRLKERIDRRFMEQFSELEPMATPAAAPPPGTDPALAASARMRCSGCAACDRL